MDAPTSQDRRYLPAQVDILKLLARDAEPTDVLIQIVELAESTLPGTVAGVTIIDRAAHALEKAIFPSLDPAFANSLGGVLIGPPHVGTCAQALYRGEVVSSDDLAKDTRFSPDWIALCAEHGIHSCRSHPLLSDQGVPLGTFMMCFSEPHKVTETDASVISTCAEMVSLTLARKRQSDHRAVIDGELSHRTRNLFAVIQALARASFLNGPGEQAYRNTFEPRLLALTTAHGLIFSNEGMDLGDLLMELLKPYREGGAIELRGPKLSLSTEATLALSIVIHELATNATKYGALSTGSGKLRIDWTGTPSFGIDSRFELRWIESDGPSVTDPKREGFGTKAIKQLVSRELEGDVTLTYPPTGFHCVVEAPFSRISLS